MQPGDTLAHYEIRAPLGKGGMGEVFMATDTKLGRDVAIKILPDDFTRDPERVARFRREAQVLASLNHPNVSAIYGLEEDDGRLFLVMELALGEDLSHRLAGGPLPQDEALRLAGQIATGLAEAHEKGIVHRDLKPANVVADAEGKVKILDFGLARAFGGDEETSDGSGAPSHSPTITAAMTQPGMVMGTAAYMSPEQARGQTAGKQADIWAFGCLLFEMLTGRRIFAGETVSDSVAAILKNEPPWDQLPDATPAPIRRLLRRCLAKDKQYRLHDIGDAWIEIEDALAGGEEPRVAAGSANVSSRGRWLWPAATAVLAVVVAALALRGTGGREAGAVTTGPRIESLVQLTDQAGMQTQPSLSPDGRTLAYSSWDGGDQDIFVQRVGGANPINLTAGHGGLDATPAFSPDGEKIAFHSDREGGGLFVMGATGETPLRVAPEGVHPAWSPDGRSLAYTTEYILDPYSRDNQALLWVTDLETGQIRQLTQIDAVVPSWSPSGKRIAFWSHLATVMGQRDIYTVGVDGGEPVAVTEDNPTDWSPQWSPDGHWIYFISDRGGSPDLWRVGIDEATGRTTTAPEAVTAGMTRITQAAVSASGTLALTAAAVSGEILTLAFDPVNEATVGRPATLLTSANAFTQMSVAQDGSLIAYRTTAPEEHIYVMNPDGSGRRRLVADEHRNRGPKISPDNRWVLFYSNRSGHYEIWAVRTDGTGLRQVTEDKVTDFNDPEWTADGQVFALAQNPEAFTAKIDLPAGGLDALTGPVGFTVLPESESYYGFRLSPDGRRAAFFLLSRDMEVFVRDMETGKLTPVTVDGRPARYPVITWLDNDRIVFWEESMKQTILWSAATGKGRFLADLEGPATFGFADRGRRVFVNHTMSKADIWLLTLEP